MSPASWEAVRKMIRSKRQIRKWTHPVKELGSMLQNLSMRRRDQLAWVLETLIFYQAYRWAQLEGMPVNLLIRRPALSRRLNDVESLGSTHLPIVFTGIMRPVLRLSSQSYAIMRSVSVDDWRLATMGLHQIWGCSRFFNQVCLPQTANLFLYHYPCFSTSATQIGAHGLVADWLNKQTIPESDREWSDHHDEYYSFTQLNSDGWKWGVPSHWVAPARPSLYFSTQMNLTISQEHVPHSTLTTLWADTQERFLTWHGFLLLRWDSVVCESRNTRSLTRRHSHPSANGETSLGSTRHLRDTRINVFWEGTLSALRRHCWPTAKATSCGMPEVVI